MVERNIDMVDQFKYDDLNDFCVKFLNKLDIKKSNPELLYQYNTTINNLINNSPMWNQILENLKTNDNSYEFMCKMQYLVYHCIICLTNQYSEKWSKYYEMVKNINIPIYPTTGHFKLMITIFNKIHHKISIDSDYFSNEQNCLYFTMNEFLCDFNDFQIHYLHTVFNMENFNLNSYCLTYPQAFGGEYAYVFHPEKEESYEMERVLSNLTKSDFVTHQYKLNYIHYVVNYLYHKEMGEYRSKKLTISDKQLQDIIYILGSFKYNIHERYSTFLNSLDDTQICYVGYKLPY